MIVVTLSELKSHLRITTADDDALLQVYGDAAETYVHEWTGTLWDTLQGSPLAKAAVLLLVGDLYENREAQTEKPLAANATVERLLWPLRQF